MVRDFIYPVLRCVHWVEYYRLGWGGDVDEVRSCISELRFLHVCLWWFSRYNTDDKGEENNFENLKSMLDAIGTKWEKEGVLDSTKKEKFQFKSTFQKDTWKATKEEFMKEFQARTSGKEETESRDFKIDYEDYRGAEQECDVPWLKAIKAIENWELRKTGRSRIERTIEECKHHVRGQSTNLLHCKFSYRAAPNADQMLKFLDAILKNLKRLVGEVVTLKNPIEIFEEKLILLRAVFKLVPDDCALELRDFRKALFEDISNDINKLAWLTFFFWAKAGDEKITDDLNLLLCDMSRKIIKPSVPDLASWYFGVLKAIRLQQPNDALLLGQAVTGFLDLLFEYLEIPFDEDIEILRDGLIILFTFLADPIKKYVEDKQLSSILDRLGDLLHTGSSLFPPFDDAKKVHLRNFLTMIERLKGKIRMLHNYIPDLSSHTFPRINGLGFIDFLLQNLKENLNTDKMFVIPFAKHLIMKIQEELVSLRPDLDDISELQKEHKDLQETWLHLLNLAYLTEHVVNSCPVVLYPIWYNMICLSEILDEIQFVKERLDTVKHSDYYNIAVDPKSVGNQPEIKKQGSKSGANVNIVGVEKEVDTIVDQLTRGPKSLEIVSIVGMGGSGKTTLARKVYDLRQVRKHFHLFAFCTVSQVYSTRKLLLEILKNINEVFVDDDSKKDDDYFAHLLYKQLSGKSYLVVMDDIWNIDAWEKVKSSFPNDNEGSRVIFTTREGEVARKANSKLNPHSKHLLSDKESWKLLQTMAFDKGGCPPNLSDVGQVIAKNCGGLPLAVEVIGRLLARKDRSMRVWKEIAEKTSSFASEEGCMKALELSYNHLPEHLKSCFLYLGIFTEDESIPAKRLILLWVAEGFMKKSQTESIEIVAKEYLTELVDRSLVHVAKRGSDNGIKTCQLHDVIRDFCQGKAQEGRFFQLGISASNSSNSNRYRLSIHTGLESVAKAEHRKPSIKSLLYEQRWRDSYRCDGKESIFSKFQLVQVLDLENLSLMGQRSEVYKIIESMTSLVHLRSLAVSIGEGDFGIPSRMADLKNLETIIFQRNNNAGHVWWSETFWRMERLRHVEVGRCYLIPCPSIFEAYPPLYNLECFSTLVLKPGTAMTILKRFPNLRKLSCFFSSFSSSGEILALDTLTRLESLKLRAYGENVILPPTLKKLSLHGCSLCSQITQLSQLEVLKINGLAKFTWDIEDGDFPELKFLKLENPVLREWNAFDGCFPRLQQLVLVDCQELLEIPACFRESTTLERIEVRSSNASLANSAREVQDEQKDLGNEIKLIILDPRD